MNKKFVNAFQKAVNSVRFLFALLLHVLFINVNTEIYQEVANNAFQR